MRDVGLGEDDARYDALIVCKRQVATAKQAMEPNGRSWAVLTGAPPLGVGTAIGRSHGAHAGAHSLLVGH
jgi:hypothetical protein